MAGFFCGQSLFSENCRALFRLPSVHSSPAMMHIPIHFTRPSADTEPPAFVRVVSRNDVQWGRPVFKAPPLAVPTPLIEVTQVFTEFARDPRFVR